MLSDSKVIAINLSRTPHRWESFERANQGVVQYDRFEAIDGALVDRQVLIDKGLIEPDLEYTNGALGVALSHLTLWHYAAENNITLTICEDDAVFNHNFASGAEFLAAKAPDFDIILWGWNMDATLCVQVHGQMPVAMVFDQDQMRASIPTFRGGRVAASLHPLTQGMGLVCYTISAVGAYKLLNKCLPLRPFQLDLPLGRGSLHNIGLDVVLSALYETVAAYVCFPPLVVTPNDARLSTTRPENQVVCQNFLVGA